MNKDEIDLIVIPSTVFCNAITKSQIQILEYLLVKMEFEYGETNPLTLGRISREIENLKRSLI